MDLQLYFAVYIYSDLTIINNDSIGLFWNIEQRGEGMSEVKISEEPSASQDKEEIIDRLNELPESYRLAATLILFDTEKNPDSFLPRGVSRLVS